MTLAYRDDLQAAHLRHQVLLERYAREIALVPEVIEVRARRYARIVAGQTAVTGATVVVIAALFDAMTAYSRPLGRGGSGLLTLLLLGSGLAAIAAAPVARWLERLSATTLHRQALEVSGDAHADLARLEANAPSVASACAPAVAFERASVFWPLAGLSLLFPLTVHYVVASIVDGVPYAPTRFDGWIRMSLLLVGHSHLVLCGMCWRFASKLHEGAALESVRPARAGLIALAVAAASAIVPTVFFAPPIVVATGIIPVPVMFWYFHRVMRAERRVLDRVLDGDAGQRL